MLQFEKIRWKNFLSTGNQWTEIDLAANKTTLIVGKNGSGKSTLLDALSYGLYNKPFRKITKPQLMNTITGKGLMVEVEFKLGRKNYKVRRGMKPFIFEIYVNDKLVPQDARNLDYQTQFQTNVLKLNHKSFIHIVALGKTNFVPFMQLAAYWRRQFIEDLLDIQVFSTMNLLLRDRVNKTEAAIVESEHQIELTKSKMEMNNQHVREIKANARATIEEKRAKIKGYLEENKELVKKMRVMTLEREKHEATRVKYDKLSETYTQCKAKKGELGTKIKKLEADIAFYVLNDDCPVCKQKIDHNHKAPIQLAKQKQITQLESFIKKLDVKIKEIDARLTKIGETHGVHSAALQRDIASATANINSNKRFVTSLQEEVESLQGKMKELHAEGNTKKELEKELLAKKDAKKEHYETREVLGMAQQLLKDGGIKTKIIKQYIPIINKLINKYLAALDFFVEFNINEEFEEKILSRFRDEFSYESFSEGEKLRIDLALLFTWRAIAKMRNSASSNLLIMDEIFDSSLDSTGIEEFLKILQQVTKDTNVIIISHNRTETMSDKFDKTLRFDKIKNFSKLSEAA